MSPQFRKVALIAASLGLLLSLFLALRPQDEATTTLPTTTTERSRTTIGIVVEDGKPVGGIRRATVVQGRDVVLTVVADVSDHVHVHGYDVFADVAPGAPARLAFQAALPGRFEVELEDRGVLLAELEVRP